MSTYVLATPATLALIAEAQGQATDLHRTLARAYERMQGDQRYQTVCNDVRRLLEDARGVANQLTVMHDEDAGLATARKNEKARARR